MRTIQRKRLSSALLALYAKKVRLNSLNKCKCKNLSVKKRENGRILRKGDFSIIFPRVIYMKFSTNLVE